MVKTVRGSDVHRIRPNNRKSDKELEQEKCFVKRSEEFFAKYPFLQNVLTLTPNYPASGTSRFSITVAVIAKVPEDMQTFRVLNNRSFGSSAGHVAEAFDVLTREVEATRRSSDRANAQRRQRQASRESGKTAALTIASRYERMAQGAADAEQTASTG